MKRHSLTKHVAAVLQTELDGHGIAVSVNGNVVLTISRENYERRLGHLFQQVQQVINRHFPDRQEDLMLQFQTQDGARHHLFRVWHPVPQT